MNITEKQRDVIEYILNKIQDNFLTPGDRLDSELAISKAIGVTRTTVREATRYLVDKKTIYRVKGSGLYVGSDIDPLEKEQSSTQSNFDKQAEKNGEDSRRKVISASISSIPSVQIAHSLRVKPNEKVYVIERLLSFGTKPVALEKTYIPLTILSDLQFQEMEKSKHSYLEKMTGKKIKTREQDISAFNLNDEKACDLLDVSEGQAMIELREVVYFVDGTPCEYNISTINSDLFNIHQVIHKES